MCCAKPHTTGSTVYTFKKKVQLLTMLTTLFDSESINHADKVQLN